MRLAVDRLTALRALRAFRAEGRALPAARCDLPAPDPSPRHRWGARALPLDRLALDAPPTGENPVEVAVPDAASRVQASFAHCRVRGTSIPAQSFVDLGGGLFIPAPELLFYELADVMSLEALALVGYELCGTYARDAADPRLGGATYDLPPATSVEKIDALLHSLGYRPTALLARRALSFVADGAWSPMEAIVALMARLPADECGYELGRVRLNVRHGATPELVALGCRESRVPDIEIVGTHVGFNYDGGDHLDLESIARGAEAGDPLPAMRAVREKYLDDLRRNRELAAMGRVILPVTAQDLFRPGGLDAVMLEAAMTIDELDGGFALQNTRAAMAVSSRERRQRLLWSLLPWPEGARYAHELRASSPW